MLESARRAQVLLLGLGGAIFLATALAAGTPGFSNAITPMLISTYSSRHGTGSNAKRRMENWQEFVREAQAASGPGSIDRPVAELLSIVNRFFNGLRAAYDQDTWGMPEYWATPAEFLSKGAGDCEDYAIGKYFTLRELGVPLERLRLVYATTTRSSTSAHLVLAYYPMPGAMPVILDNLTGSIEPASDRHDLTPVFVFNDEDIGFLPQLDMLGKRLSGTSVRQWQEVVVKLLGEQAL
jgi:predicted transglutaminase-like cysteine proteinase